MDKHFGYENLSVLTVMIIVMAINRNRKIVIVVLRKLKFLKTENHPLNIRYKETQKRYFRCYQKIISMYAEGRQISETIEDIYGFEISEGFISDVTDKILPQIEDWQNRPLDEVYSILYINAIHYSVRDNGMIHKLAAYVILRINAESKKEVLTFNIRKNESSKY